MRRVLSERGELLLEKSPNLGCEELREAIKSYLRRNRGITVDSEQIIIGSGSEYLYGLIVELLGRTRVFAIESPSYKKIEQVYKATEITYELLPLTQAGIESKALAFTSADVLHTTPYRSYPSGVTATASKRHEYLRWASKKKRYIIEDDFESEFSVSSKPTETLFSLSKHDNVIYLNTFSKTISPSLRIGYMVLPRHLVSVYKEKLGFYSCTVPTFMQYVLTELLNNGDFERHINRIRRKIRKNISQ
jgi:GntR family transcriptional regulator/MocR family aminotransferase